MKPMMVTAVTHKLRAGWLGAGVAVAAVAAIAAQSGVAMLLGSLGASAMLMFCFPDLPASQPRNVVYGHLISGVIGLAAMSVLGPGWWSVGLAVALAIYAMHLTGTAHPPAASNPVIVFAGHAGWSFLLPAMAGVAVVVALAAVWSWASRRPGPGPSLLE